MRVCPVPPHLSRSNSRAPLCGAAESSCRPVAWRGSAQTPPPPVLSQTSTCRRQQDPRKAFQRRGSAEPRVSSWFTEPFVSLRRGSGGGRRARYMKLELKLSQEGTKETLLENIWKQGSRYKTLVEKLGKLSLFFVSFFQIKT